MKDYSEISDFELNVQVAESEGINWYCPASCSPTGGWEYCGIGKLMLKDDKQLPDYCNNPSDAWQIIIENSITFNYDTAQVHVGSYFSDTAKVSENRKNALRAAMIVYLMMKDA